MSCFYLELGNIKECGKIIDAKVCAHYNLFDTVASKKSQKQVTSHAQLFNFALFSYRFWYTDNEEWCYLRRKFDQR